MSLKLYEIFTTLNDHPDFWASLKKHSDEVRSFFNSNEGDERQIKNKRLEFIAGEGYTLENIEKTDYVPGFYSVLLFSRKFVERVGEALQGELQFFPCKLICQGVELDWYAARIMRIMPLLDKEKTTYFTMTTGEKYVGIPKYREDIEEPFFIARDEEHTVFWVVSELFKDLCDRNGLQIEYSEAGVFSCETAHQSGTDCNLPDGLVKMSDPKCSHVSMELKEKILEFAKLLMNEKIIALDNFEKFSKQNYEDIVLGIKQQLHDTYPKTKLKKQMKSVHYANGFSDENLKQSAFILDDIEQYLSINGFMDYDTSVRYYNETITTDGFEINPQSLVMTMIDSLLVCVHGDKNMQ